MDLSGYMAVLRRWSLTLLAAAVMAGGVAFLAAGRIAPTYEAESEVLVGPINTDQNTLGAAQELVQTYAELVTSESVLRSVIADLGITATPESLRESTTARANSVTRLLTILARAADPDTAAAIANGLATGLEELASAGQVRPEGEVTVINAAEADTVPVEPQTSLIVLLASAAGLIAALAVVLLIDYFGNTVSGREDLANLAQAPFLGAIAIVRGFRPRPTDPLVVEARPDSRAALAYRLLGTKIAAGDPKSGIRSLLVLGTEGREGSGEVAANLAAVLTRAGRSIRLVDANDEDAEITHLFGLKATYGLGELARGGDEVLGRMIHRRSPGMDVIPHLSGSDPRMIEHARARQVLGRLSTDVDLVILNAAPIHRSASALLWARTADAVILVAQRDKTKRENVTFTVETLRLLDTVLLGTVLHGAPRRGGSGDLPGPEGAHASTRHADMPNLPPSTLRPRRRGLSQRPALASQRPALASQRPALASQRPALSRYARGARSDAACPDVCVDGHAEMAVTTTALTHRGKQASPRVIAAVSGLGIAAACGLAGAATQSMLPLAGVVVLGLGLLLLKRPDIGTLVFLALLWINAPAVATRFHNVPEFAASAVSLLLFIPVVGYLLRRQPIVVTPALFAILAFLAANLLSAAFSQNPAAGWSRIQSFLSEGLLVYLLVTNAVRTPKLMRSATWVLVLAAVVMSGLSIHQELTESYRDPYLGFAQTTLQEEAITTQPDADSRPRMMGPIGEQNRYAQILLVVLPLALLGLHKSGHGPRRLVSSIAMLVILGGVLLTFSRGAAVALAILLIVLVVGRYVRLSHMLLLVSGFMLTVVVIAPDFTDRVASIRTVAALASGDGEAPDGAVLGRTTSNLAALLAFADHPVVGVGPGVYSEEFSLAYANDLGLRHFETGRRAHNMYLEVAAEVGAMGLLALLGAVVVTILQLARARRFWRVRRPDYSLMAGAFSLGLICYLATALFLHLSYERYFWTLLALANGVIWILGREAAALQGHTGASRILRRPAVRVETF